MKPNARLTILLGSLSMFGPISIDMYLPSLPSLAEDLGTDPAGAQLTVAAFLIGLAIGQLFYGPLSDRVGRRAPLMLGISFFVVATLGCALASSIEALIVMRFVQALGASVGMVVARAVIADLFDRHEAAKMFSMLALVFGLAPILAPMMGGWILLVYDWHAIFVALAVFGVVVLAIAFARLKESRSEETAERARQESPLRAYRAVAGKKRLIGFGLAGALGGSCIFTYIAASPSLLIDTYGVAPENYGYIFGLNAVGFVAASQINRHLLARHPVHKLLKQGLAGGLLAGIALLGLAVTGIGGLPALLPPLFLVVASLGFIMPNGVAGAMAVDLERSGTTGALIGSLQFVAGSLGAIAVGLFYDGSAIPMAATIVAAMILASICLKGLVGELE